MQSQFKTRSRAFSFNNTPKIVNIPISVFKQQFGPKPITCQLRSQVYPDERGKVRRRKHTVPFFSSQGWDATNPISSCLDSMTSVSQIFKLDSSHWSRLSETWATLIREIVGSCGCITSLLNRLISMEFQFIIVFLSSPITVFNSALLKLSF